MAQEKGHYNIVFIGHVDHGKSTMVGRLMYDSGMLPETEYKKLKAEAESRGKGSFAFAYMMVSDSLIQNIIRERVKRVKQQMTLSGMNIPAYWISHYLIDIIF